MHVGTEVEMNPNENEGTKLRKSKLLSKSIAEQLSTVTYANYSERVICNINDSVYECCMDWCIGLAMVSSCFKTSLTLD